MFQNGIQGFLGYVFDCGWFDFVGFGQYDLVVYGGFVKYIYDGKIDFFKVVVIVDEQIDVFQIDLVMQEVVGQVGLFVDDIFGCFGIVIVWQVNDMDIVFFDIEEVEFVCLVWFVGGLGEIFLIGQGIDQ